MSKPGVTQSIRPARVDPWGSYQTLRIAHDTERRVLSYYIKATPRACFTRQVLEELSQLQDSVRCLVERDLQRLGRSSIEYIVAASDASDGTHFGGDLRYFLEVIRAGDRKSLSQYAHLGIDVLYSNFTKLGAEIATVAEIRGTTLGAGFEAALSCDVIIADKTAQFGFPEILFNMFPGMGAYSFLARRISPAQAERMIASGRMYSAEDLYEMGIIDILADKGATGEAVSSYIRASGQKANTRRAVFKLRKMVNPITREELIDIVDLWIDSAFRMTDSNLAMMERLLRAQERRAGHGLTSKGWAVG